MSFSNFICLFSIICFVREVYTFNDSGIGEMSTFFTEITEAPFSKKIIADYDSLDHDDQEHDLPYRRKTDPGEEKENQDEDEDWSQYISRQSPSRRRHHSPVEKRPTGKRERFGGKGCVLKVRKDFGEPQPIFVHDGKLLQINDKSDRVRLKYNESLTVSCPGKGRLITLNGNIFKKNETVANCAGKTMLRVGKYWTGKSKHIECNGNPQLQIQETDEQCFHQQYGTQIFRVGYRAQDMFHQLYHACFDREKRTTHYVHHKISPKTKYRQHGGGRPYFTRERETFGDVRVSDSYRVPIQRKMINSVVGKDTLGKYINEKHFLDRLQLAPRLDYILRPEQRAAFTYINTVPQWKHIKEGDWAKLEAGLRERAHDLNSTLRVWTGTYGVWAVEGRGRKEHQVFLMQNQANQAPTTMPVPLYVYKLVYLRCEMKATVFVSLNLPPRSSFEEHQPKIFCPDVCKSTHRKFRWLDWTNRKSISFCCTYKDFAKKVHLPKLEVADLFY